MQISKLLPVVRSTRRTFSPALTLALAPAVALALDLPTHAAPHDPSAHEAREPAPLAVAALRHGAALAPLHDGPWTSGRPDGHAPIGVMGDHVHRAGEWMVSFRSMVMDMDGNRSGTDRVPVDEVLDRWMVAPTSMTMIMHMLGLMVAPTDDLTVMVMVPYIELEMDHVTRSGVEFTTESSGLGDVKLSGLYTFWRENVDGVAWQAHGNLGLSLPTGSIDEEDVTPASMGQDVQLPYPMQLGSGTFDLQPGLTLLGQVEDWSFGAQALQTVRLGENDRDYTLGDRTDVTIWGARRLGQAASGSLRLAYGHWGDIDGADDDLNPNMVPTADPDRRGGDRVDLLAGVNLYAAEGALAGHRLALEVGLPVYQNLNGPQLEVDWLATIGWQYAR